MASGLKTRLDYEDYRAIPPDGKRWELVDGEIEVTPAPSPFHQELVGNLFILLRAQFHAPVKVFVAPVDFIFGPHDVMQPDLVVTDPAQVSDRGIEGPPLIVVEVLSPTTTVYDRTIKSRRYAALDVPHYWIVDPAMTRLECYRLETRTYREVATASLDEVLAHPDFPALRLALGALWPQQGHR
jgi:Uma2 family endonuclease